MLRRLCPRQAGSARVRTNSKATQPPGRRACTRNSSRPTGLGAGSGKVRLDLFRTPPEEDIAAPAGEYRMSGLRGSSLRCPARLLRTGGEKGTLAGDVR